MMTNKINKILKRLNALTYYNCMWQQPQNGMMHSLYILEYLQRLLEDKTYNHSMNVSSSYFNRRLPYKINVDLYMQTLNKMRFNEDIISRRLINVTAVIGLC